MSITMKAKVAQVYGGRRIKADEVFPVRGRTDARLLFGMGRAEIVASDVPAVEAPPPPPAAPVTPRAPDMPEVEPPAPICEPETPDPMESSPVECSGDAEPTEPSLEPQDPPERPRRAYRRRDMAAESSR